MHQEKLTLENIKFDIRKLMKNNYVFLILLLVFSIALAVVGIYLLSYTGIKKRVHGVLALLLSATLVMTAVLSVKDSIIMRKYLKTDPIIVKDKLVDTEEKSYYRRGMVYHHYYLKFLNYGDYVVGSDNYSWNVGCAMDKRGLFLSSNLGDEFYLVLNKRRRGYILEVYNCKYFKLEDNGVN